MASRAIVAAWIFGLIVAAVVAVEPDQEQLKRWSRQLTESMDWYRLAPGRDSKAVLKSEIVLRWANPTRSQKGETALVLWTDAGRPEALASVYPWSGHLNFECISLARSPGLVASENGRAVWDPATPGVKFQELADAPAPAKVATTRLAQMKAIAESFKVRIVGQRAGAGGREDLRLLPKAIYRHDLAGAQAVHSDLIDGAVFAFVQGTDPEAVLIVEAVRRGDRTAWQYAFGRATSWNLEAKLGSTLVWTASDQPSWSDPRLPAIVVGRRLID